MNYDDRIMIQRMQGWNKKPRFEETKVPPIPTRRFKQKTEALKDSSQDCFRDYKCKHHDQVECHKEPLRGLFDPAEHAATNNSHVKFERLPDPDHPGLPKQTATIVQRNTDEFFWEKSS